MHYNFKKEIFISHTTQNAAFLMFWNSTQTQSCCSLKN